MGLAIDADTDSFISEEIRQKRTGTVVTSRLVDCLAGLVFLNTVEVDVEQVRRV